MKNDQTSDLNKVRYVNGVMIVELKPGEIEITDDEIEVLNMHPTLSVTRI